LQTDGRGMPPSNRSHNPWFSAANPVNPWTDYFEFFYDNKADPLSNYSFRLVISPLRTSARFRLDPIFNPFLSAQVGHGMVASGTRAVWPNWALCGQLWTKLCQAYLNNDPIHMS
jgi:hypothetical protein